MDPEALVPGGRTTKVSLLFGSVDGSTWGPDDVADGSPWAADGWVR